MKFGPGCWRASVSHFFSEMSCGELVAGSEIFQEEHLNFFFAMFFLFLSSDCTLPPPLFPPVFPVCERKGALQLTSESDGKFGSFYWLGPLSLVQQNERIFFRVISFILAKYY